MQTARKIEPVQPSHVRPLLRRRFALPVGKQAHPLDIALAIRRLEEDEILFMARSIPTIGGAGVG